MQQRDKIEYGQKGGSKKKTWVLYFKVRLGQKHEHINNKSF